MASKRKRANRDHRAVALKSARTRTLMAMARAVKHVSRRDQSYVAREIERARKLLHDALGGAV